MTLYERYINGQTEKVYQDILALRQDAFLTTNLPDIEKVLTETFQRVSYNIDIIYSELIVNYLFKSEFKYNFERPIVKPLADTEKLLTKLDTVVRIRICATLIENVLPNCWFVQFCLGL